MKLKKLNGFGSLGCEVTDLNLNTASDDELVEFGRVVADQLCVLVRKENCSLKPERLNHIAKVFGDPYGGEHLPQQNPYHLIEKKKQNGTLNRQDLKVLKEMRKIRNGIEENLGQIWVTGKKDEEGDYLGLFADGELDWHSDRQGTGNFCPCIGLMAIEGTEGTCTEFLQTADAYESLSSKDKNFLDNLIAIHSYTPGKIAPGLNISQDNIVRMNMCPIDMSEVPVVCNSPTGRKGIRLSYNTIFGFLGHTEEETDDIIKWMKDIFLKEEYVYHHDWQDGDIVWMDQTITVHRRPTKDCSKRVMIRQTCNFDNIFNKGTQGLQLVGREKPGIIIDGKLVPEDYVDIKFHRTY